MSDDPSRDEGRLVRPSTSVRGACAAGSGRIPRRGGSGDAPLSLAQQWLWCLDPTAPIHNSSRAYRLEGVFDLDALGAALALVVRRHEILRTVFVIRDGQPRQLRTTTESGSLTLVDLSERPVPTRWTQLHRRLAEDARVPFDPETRPPFRATLFRLAPRAHILLVCASDLVCDGRSHDLLVRELVEGYAAIVAERNARLPELPIQFADFAAWQQATARAPRRDAAVEYWSQQLADGSPVLELSRDRPCSSRRLARCRSRGFVLDRDPTARLVALGREEGATLFMTLVAAFQVLLFRHTGQTRFLIGALAADRDRDREETRNLIGPLAAAFLVKAELFGAWGFRELLRRVRETTRAAYDHREVPPDKVMERLVPDPDLERNPPFRVVIAREEGPVPPITLPGLVLSPFPLERVLARTDLSLTVQDREGGLAGTFEYDADRFEASTIGRMPERWTTLLEGIVGDPRRPISTLAILPPAERTLLAAWAVGANTGPPRDGCAHDLFESRAIQRPTAAAVVSRQGTLTYHDLNERANRLAHHLRRHGVGPEVRVGLYLENSPEAIVGILAVLKAGGAYVPLDPGYPADRIHFMLGDAEVAVVLTRQTRIDALPESAARTVRIDSDGPAIAAESARGPAGSATPANLAYVIYTSGSTGQPKGVMVEHRSLVNYIESAIGDYGLGAGDRVLQFASLSWDTSVEEIFPCLSSGATLVLRASGPVEAPPQFWQDCQDAGVTVMNLPTAYWNVLVTDEGFRASVLPPSLRWMIIGGERVLAASVARWQREAAGLVKLVNTYGITEATAAVTLSSELGGLQDAREPECIVPIGRPIRNVRTHVLDSNREPVPVGVVGELYIGGLGLARGYVGRPRLTAERFLPDPFGAEPGARLYRTGDRVRWRGDGQLEYLGRDDHQVKLRGYRIEMGEIEAVLAGHPGVRQVAVVVAPGLRDEGQLVAYVAPAGGVSGPGVEELRRYLRRKLPGHMVPGSYVILESLPLTPGGKVDRQALPRFRPGAGGESESEPARGPVEEMLVVIWRQVLGTPTIGRRDNFFALGGDSIRSLMVVSKTARAGWRIAVRELFQHPTVADLAAVATPLDHRPAPPTAVAGPPIEPVGRDRDLPLSSAQQPLWSINQDLPGAGFFNIPIHLHILGALDVDALARSLSELTSRHEILRTTYAVRHGRPSQVIAAPGPFNLPGLDLSDRPAEERGARLRFLVAQESRRGFDLSRDPPLRALLVRLGAEEFVLALTVHHIAFDGWSSDILLEAVARLYRAFVQDQEPPAVTAAIQYADYAAWQQKWLRSPAADRDRSYWLARLNDGPQQLDLPADHARAASWTLSYHRRILTLGRSLTERIHAFSSRVGATPFMTVLAAMNGFLGQATGREDIWVGTLSADRSDPGTEGLIGLFLNTLILRTDLAGDPTFDQLVRRVRTVTLEAFDHQTLPFEHLLDALRDRLDLTQFPLLQVLFVFQNAPTLPAPWPGLRIEPWRDLDPQSGAELNLSSFDLIVEILTGAEGLEIHWRGNADLFEPGTIERMSSHYRRLLIYALDRSDQPLSTWPRAVLTGPPPVV